MRSCKPGIAAQLQRIVYAGSGEDESRTARPSNRIRGIRDKQRNRGRIFTHLVAGNIRDQGREGLQQTNQKPDDDQGDNQKSPIGQNGEDRHDDQGGERHDGLERMALGGLPDLPP
jgi:hypothetical protein